MAITSTGYPGQVNAAAFAAMGADFGVRYTTDASALAPTVVSVADRTIKLAAGAFQGRSVRDTLTADTNVQVGAITTGTRWDLVVARRSWTTGGGTTTLAVVPGDATQTTALANRRQSPGTQDGGSSGGDDQPLALVQVTAGSSVPTGLVDLRCHHGDDGLLARDALALQYLTRLGTCVRVGATTWTRSLDPSSGTAVWSPAQLAADAAPGGGMVPFGTDYDAGRVTRNGVVATFCGMVHTTLGVYTNSVVWTVPAGFRPGKNVTVVGLHNDSVCRLIVSPTGQVLFQTGGVASSGGWLSLNASWGLL
jgi:hypothetical protein